MSYTIRKYGDPVLKTAASPVEDVDGKVVRLVDGMFETLTQSSNGLALAAPQIGVQKQVVVWDFGEDPLAIINPEIVESDGEWVYDEGCLSIPGLYVEMLRPKQVLVRTTALVLLVGWASRGVPPMTVQMFGSPFITWRGIPIVPLAFNEAVELVRQLCGLESLNLIDRRNYPVLCRRLKDALKLDDMDIAEEAREYMNEKAPARTDWYP